MKLIISQFNSYGGMYSLAVPNTKKEVLIEPSLGGFNITLRDGEAILDKSFAPSYRDEISNDPAILRALGIAETMLVENLTPEEQTALSDLIV